MKKYFNTLLTVVSVLFISTFFSGCDKDSPCKRSYTYSYFNPVYKTTDEVKANIKSNASRDIQNPGKIYIFGKYIFLNQIDKGIHIIDNNNPSSPKNVAFIDIPGNMDLAVKGNALYADLYSDLVTIDITEPLNAKVKKYNEGVFPFRAWGTNFHGDSTKVIVDWIKKDTVVTAECTTNWAFEDRSVFFMADANTSQASSFKASVSPIGKGGSMARFAIVNNRMYTVSNADLNVFNISAPYNPSFSNSVNLNWGIETIFPFKDKLFIGSQSGMFIYNISNPDEPTPAGQFAHVNSCDPVIADNKYAYVTLRSGTTCQGFTNQLDVLQLNNVTNPQLVKSYQFTNPHGLSKDGNLLFICDGTDGLKIYNAADPKNLKLIKRFSNIETYDVIADNKIALVVAKGGLYQYSYSNISNIRYVSKIGIAKN
jgi:hypothetical protein